MHKKHILPVVIIVAFFVFAVAVTLFPCLTRGGVKTVVHVDYVAYYPTIENMTESVDLVVVGEVVDVSLGRGADIVETTYGLRCSRPLSPPHSRRRAYPSGRRVG